MSHVLESDFISKEGYRCIVLGVSHGHRCGYVAVPRGHVLYGIEYSEELPEHVATLTQELLRDTEIGHRGVMPIFLAAMGGSTSRLDVVIDVHGSLTFSAPVGEYPVPTDTDVWWFGFDCGHSGDGKDFSLMDERIKEFYRDWGYYSNGPIRTTDYVESHCRLLSRQLWYINQMAAQLTLPEGEASC
jgi:hypothetical protein